MNNNIPLEDFAKYNFAYIKQEHHEWKELCKRHSIDELTELLKCTNKMIKSDLQELHANKDDLRWVGVFGMALMSSYIRRHATIELIAEKRQSPIKGVVL